MLVYIVFLDCQATIITVACPDYLQTMSVPAWLLIKNYLQVSTWKSRFLQTIWKYMRMYLQTINKAI